VDPHIAADLNPGSKNIGDPDPRPVHKKL